MLHERGRGIVEPLFRRLPDAIELGAQRVGHHVDELVAGVIEYDLVEAQICLEDPPLESDPLGPIRWVCGVQRVDRRALRFERHGEIRAKGDAAVAAGMPDRSDLDQPARIHELFELVRSQRRRDSVALARLVRDQSGGRETGERFAHRSRRDRESPGEDADAQRGAAAQAALGQHLEDGPIDALAQYLRLRQSRNLRQTLAFRLQSVGYALGGRQAAQRPPKNAHSGDGASVDRRWAGAR